MAKRRGRAGKVGYTLRDGGGPSLVDLLGATPGAAEVDLPLPERTELAQPAAPQRVTRRGRPVVVAIDELERLCRLDSDAAPTFGRLLAAMPTDDGEFERLEVSPRDVEL